MEEEKFWHLLSNKLTGEASAEELTALDKLLQDNPEFGLKAQMLMQMWKPTTAVKDTTDDFFNRHLQRLSNHPDVYPAVLSSVSPPEANPFALSEQPTRKKYRWLLPLTGIAASVAVIMVFLYPGQFNNNNRKDPAAQNTVTTRKGSKSSIQLPDGSVAWLNADSKLVYDENFRGDLREVTLQGEAYFDVVKDKTKPFIIHTKTIDIRVLGTAFNVRAYETEKQTETSLFRGSVEITLHNSPEKKIVLKPNEKLLVNNKSLAVSAKQEEKSKKNEGDAAAITVGKVHFEAKDSSALETGWIKNKLVFDAETLEEVAQKIERWYDVKVVINGDEDLKNTAYSAIFENENLLQVMEALKITGSFKYSISKGIITIR